MSVMTLAPTSQTAAPDGAPRLDGLGPRLYFLDVDWAAVPAWARFFVELGEMVGSIDAPSRVIVPIAIPTRAYAAALCAVGIVHGRLGTPVAGDVEAHLAYLRTLPPYTTVTFRRGDRRQTGWLMGCVTENDREYLEIRQKGIGRHLILASMVLTQAVQPSKRPRETLPTNARGRVIRLRSGLLGGVLEPTVAVEFLRQDRLDCMIVGNESILHDEIQQARFAIRNLEGELTEGMLQDILRVRKLGRDGDSYRSEILSALRKGPRHPGASAPHAVIFDGAAAFLRWGSTWPGSHSVVILDRTDYRFDEAVSEIDGAYLARLDDYPIPIDAVDGIECAAFLAKRRKS